MMFRTLLIAAPALLTVACSSPTTTNDASVAIANDVEEIAETENSVAVAATGATSNTTSSQEAFAADQYLGHWIGVEGMVLDVARGKEPDSFRLTMQWNLDDKGVFAGRGQNDPSAPGIAFTRNGEQLLLRRSDGDATGLKWLAGKKECLTVKPGEGYCRD